MSDKMKKSGISIEIKQHDLLHSWIFIDGKPLEQFYTFHQRVEIYRTTLQNVDSDITDAYQICKDSEYHTFVWLVTFKNLRQDGLVGVLLQYYLVSIIDRISKDHGFISNIAVFTWQDKPFIRFLKLRYPATNIWYKFPFFPNLAKIGFTALLPVKYLLTGLLQARLFVQKPSGYNGLEMIVAPKDFNRNRLRGYEKTTAEKQFLVLAKEVFHSVKNIPDSGTLAQYSLVAYLKNLFAAIHVTIKVNGLIKDTYRTVKSLHSEILNSQGWFQTYFLVVKQRVLEKIIGRYWPKEVIVTQTFGYPAARAVTLAAETVGVRSKVFSCRPMVTLLRSEDRILPFEIQEKNPLFGLGETFVLFDRFSQTTLIEQQYPIERIVPYVVSLQTNKKNMKLNGYLFLLTEERVNTRLIHLLSRHKPTISRHVYLKSHPLQPITKDQVGLLRRAGLDFTDVSGFKLHELDLYEVIALTTNSTSGVEAVGMGGGILWMPFFTEHCIQFADAYEKLGEVVENESQFMEKMAFFSNALHFEAFIEKCRSQYQRNFQF
jgi:hypothetical protein